MIAAGSDAIEAPNLFTLTGHHLSITLALTGIDGQPRFTYHDTQRALNFTGDEITVEDTALGRQATVTIVRTVDAGNICRVAGRARSNATDQRRRQYQVRERIPRVYA